MMETFMFRKYLSEGKTALKNFGKHKDIHLILGNESCDLDSTVSAISLGYLIKTQCPQKLVVPIMNTLRKYFPLRTESCFLLKQMDIEVDDLVFKDDFDLSSLCKHSPDLKTSIVDHHVLAESDKILERTVVEIFDHRPINKRDIIKGNVRKTIKTVGSCCTLIAAEILEHSSIIFPELAQLLYSVIIYDTLGLDKSLGKTFNEDIAIISQLEKLYKPLQGKKELFDQLWKIHNDITNITSKQLLYRDCKFVKKIPVPGLPLLVEDYLNLDDAYQSIVEFADEFQTHTVILMGIDTKEEVKRDFAIFSHNNDFKDIFINAIKNSGAMFGSDLDPQESEVNLVHVAHFHQGNVKLARKFMIPLIQHCLKLFEEKSHPK